MLHSAHCVRASCIGFHTLRLQQIPACIARAASETSCRMHAAAIWRVASGPAGCFELFLYWGKSASFKIIPGTEGFALRGMPTWDHLESTFRRGGGFQWTRQARLPSASPTARFARKAVVGFAGPTRRRRLPQVTQCQVAPCPRSMRSLRRQPVRTGSTQHKPRSGHFRQLDGMMC